MKKGTHHTKKTKEKMSKAKMGNYNPMYGKHHTKETKRKISKTEIGCTSWMKGKHHSKKARQKMSEAKMGNKICLGKHHTQKTKEKMSRMHKGENNGNWKGGITSVIAKHLNSHRWRNLSKQIRKRDNYICLYCRKKPGTDVHHMLPIQLGGTDDTENLVTLCNKCHKFIEWKIGS